MNRGREQEGVVTAEMPDGHGPQVFGEFGEMGKRPHDGSANAEPLDLWNDSYAQNSA